MCKKKGENGQNQLRYQTNCKIGKKCVTKAKNGQKQPKMAKKTLKKWAITGKHIHKQVKQAKNWQKMAKINPKEV